MSHMAALLSHKSPERTRDVQKRERPEIPDVVLVRNGLADQAAHQAGKCGHRRREPFVVQECRQADDGASQRPHHAPAQQSQQERALEHQIGEAVGVAEQAQNHAQSQSRRQEQQKLQFEVGVADLGEEHLAKDCPANQQRGERRRHADLHEQREKQVLAGKEGFHALRRAVRASGLYGSQSPAECKATAREAAAILRTLRIMAKQKTKRGASRRATAGRLRIVAEAALPTRFGLFTILGIEGRTPEETLVVLRHGRVTRSIGAAGAHSLAVPYGRRIGLRSAAIAAPSSNFRCERSRRRRRACCSTCRRKAAASAC